MKRYQTQSLGVCFKSCAITQANSPCIVTLFKVDTDLIAEGDGADFRIRVAPVENCDYPKIYSEFK